MKKNLFFLLFLAIIAVSCQKDINPSVVTNTIEQPKTDYFNSVTPKPSPNDDVLKRIDAFKALIENTSSLGSCDQISVSDAIWGIEAVLNQRYSNASKPFIAQQIDSTNFTVSLNASGEINANDVATALIVAKRELRMHWDKVRESSKHVIVTDIALRSQDATTATFTIASAIGIEQLLRTLIPPPVPFGLGEGWLDGKVNGSNALGCALTSALFGNAADKIAEKWNNRWASVPVSYFHTDVETIVLSRFGLIGGAFDIFYTNNLIYSTTFFQVNPSCITDVPHDDVLTLNDYLAGVPIFIAQLKPVGKTFVTLSMEGVREVNTFNNGRCHTANIQYGIAHTIMEPQDVP
jgi:hypothetical protein